MRYLSIILAIFMTVPATAQIYVCQKANGVPTYTSSPEGDPSLKNCKLHRSFENRAGGTSLTPTPTPIQSTSATPIKKPSAATKSTTKRTNKAAKRIPSKEQLARDNKRKEILAYEFKREQEMIENLEEVIENISASDTEKRAQLRKEQERAMLNIDAIKKELERLGLRF